MVVTRSLLLGPFYYAFTDVTPNISAACVLILFRFLFIYFLGEHTIQGQDEVEEPAEDDDDQQTLDGVQEVEEQQPQSPAVSMNIVWT